MFKNQPQSSSKFNPIYELKNAHLIIVSNEAVLALFCCDVIMSIYCVKVKGSNLMPVWIRGFGVEEVQYLHSSVRQRLDWMCTLCRTLGATLSRSRTKVRKNEIQELRTHPTYFSDFLRINEDMIIRFGGDMPLFLHYFFHTIHYRTW